MVNSEYSIAIIGMAGRFPMADSVDRFWENLKEGRDCITVIPKCSRPDYVGAYGRLDGLDMFDASFFDITKTEAEDSDPEQRIMMELAYHALENAGYSSGRYDGKIGMYASFDNGVYVWNYIMQSGEDWFENYELYKAYLATRCEKIAYKLGFTGPAVMSEYACASSLNALHQSCQSLLNYECDMALAGGVTAEPEQEGYPGYLATESSRGQIRPFDRDADGLVPGSAAGLVVLKRYEDAIADNDTIAAVIKGTFVNNDGRRKAGFTAPSVFGQKECLENVMAVSEVEPGDISYYEAHGTGTDLGDSIELKAINEVMASRDAGDKLYIGSVKSNIGHTNMAAGITNVIKTSLMLKNRMLVPSINYSSPCDGLLEDGCCLEVVTETREWSGREPMTALCSAVGMGGANAMAVLQEPDRDDRREVDEPELFIFSGKTEGAARKLKEDTEQYVSGGDVSLRDAAYTLQKGRGEFAYRAFSIMDSDRKRIRTRRVKKVREDSPAVVMVFSGVSNFDRTIGRELYEGDRNFRAHMDECFACCARNGMPDIKVTFMNFLKDGTSDIEADNVRGMQILFSLGYSLAKTFMDMGVVPDAVTGHSNGEYIAAVISGIMTMDDAVRLLKERSLLIEKLPEGGMINIACSADRIESLLTEGVYIGAYNGPSRTMVTGLKEDLDRFEEVIAAEDMMYSRSPADRASHCPVMEAIADEYGKILESADLREPVMDIVSSCCPGKGKNAMAEPSYWTEQMCSPVRFGETVTIMDDRRNSIFIEVGTGDALASIIRKVKTGADAIEAFAAFDSPVAADSRNGFLAALGSLWCAGLSIDWDALYDEKPKRVPLPLYPFERESYWKYDSNPFGRSAPRKKRRTAEAAGKNGIEMFFDAFGDHYREACDRFFCRDIVLLKDVPGYEEDGNRLVAACIMDYFRSEPAFDEDGTYTLGKLAAVMGVIDRYVPFIHYFTTFLTDYGYAEDDYGMITFLQKAKDAGDRKAVLEECCRKHPDCCAYMEFCVYAADRYDEVFRGKREGSTVIYHDGKFDFIDSFEKRMPDYSYTPSCLKALADMVAKATAGADRKVRIIELGAGSGEMTDDVLALIDDRDIEYWFTDIKRSLVAAREEKDSRDFMRYGVLDISSSPAAQGYEEGYYDIVILYDVIQATEDIGKTLGNIASLLREDGCCFFVQTCDGSELLNMIYGYAPGWWNYDRDPARTRISMAPEKWRGFLTDGGFRNVRSMPDDGTSNAYLMMMQPPVTEKSGDASGEGDMDDLERDLLDIVRGIMGTEVSLEDNLYELGMDSLMSMMIASKVQTEMKLDLQLSDMYGMMTTGEIAEFLRTADRKEDSVMEIAEPEKNLGDLFDEL